MNQSLNDTSMYGGFDSHRGSGSTSGDLLLKDDFNASTNLSRTAEKVHPSRADSNEGQELDTSSTVNTSMYNSPRALLDTRSDLKSALSTRTGKARSIKHKGTREIEKRYRVQSGD